MMKKSIKDIESIPTSHHAGMKRVLLAADESDCPITQIAITDLRAGEIAEAHIHKDMQNKLFMANSNVRNLIFGNSDILCVDDEYDIDALLEKLKEMYIHKRSNSLHNFAEKKR